MPRRCESLQEFAKLKICPNHQRQRSGSETTSTFHTYTNTTIIDDDDDNSTDTSIITPITPTDSFNSSTSSTSSSITDNHRHRSWTMGLKKKKPFNIKIQDDPSFPWPKTAPSSPSINNKNNNNGDRQSTASINSISSNSTTSSTITNASNKSKWPHICPPKRHSSPPLTPMIDDDQSNKHSSYFDLSHREATMDPPEPPPRLVPHPPLRRRSSCPCTAKMEEQKRLLKRHQQQEQDENMDPKNRHASPKVLCISDIMERSQPGPSLLKRSKESINFKPEKQPPSTSQTNDPCTSSSTPIIPPRTMQLRRRVSQRKENKALAVWKRSIQSGLMNIQPPRPCTGITEEKKMKYLLTRKFILRELYTTEVTFWNQLYFAKVMFHDALMTAILRNSPFAKKDDFDLFANLFDLLQFSAKLLQKLQYFQFDHDEPPMHLLMNTTIKYDHSTGGCADNVCIGETMCEMAREMVVFLRCALDYKENVKLIKSRDHNKRYRRYREKLLERKETRQFTMDDYLIIPIQRVARYNLLLTDLVRHTNPHARDYHDIVKAQKIVDGLAIAMNYAQK